MLAKDAAFLRSVMETRMKNTSSPTIPDYSYRGQANRIPSRDTGIGNATLAEPKMYTGTKMLGIVVQHKSCLQPVFSKDEAMDSATMRR